MKEVHLSTRFKKDFKKYENNPGKIEKLYNVVCLLKKGKKLPKKFKPHKLIGNYKGCLECHIENDFLLIWIDKENDIINLIRLGSHSELFK